MSDPQRPGIGEQIRRTVAGWNGEPSMNDLDLLLRFLCKWRSQALSRTLIARQGTVIQGGLFAGMDYATGVSEGSLAARLLGVYEHSLQPHIRRIIENGVDCVIDLGCAEGYYAVGLAVAYPQLSVHAYDIDGKARAYCADLAAKNRVAERVLIGEAFKPEDFETFAGRRVLAIVDVEGAEIELLRPDLSPALAQMSLIVETHDVWRPGALETVRLRFEATHDILVVEQTHDLPHPPAWLLRLSELDQLLVTWEWRHRLTPWLVMTPKD